MDGKLDPTERPLSFMAVLDRTAKHPSTSSSIYSDSPSRHVQFPLNMLCLSSVYTSIQQTSPGECQVSGHRALEPHSKGQLSFYPDYKDFKKLCVVACVCNLSIP